MSRFHSVKLDRDRCMGCTNCIKKCPTEAIRVRDGKAQIDDTRCIDCGECIRACPHHAKSAEMDSLDQLKDFRYNIALAAPSLYTQFGQPANRERILNALTQIGFDNVYEVSMGAEIISKKTRELLHDPTSSHPRPMISSACPVVVRLIQMKYPNLIPHLVPFDSPMDVVADLALKETQAKTGLDRNQIGIFFISPCPAKKTSVMHPLGRAKSSVTGVVAMADVYPLILGHLDRTRKDKDEQSQEHLQSGADGIRWGSSGGEALALETDRFLAVDGIHEVMAILEEIENEQLQGIDFIETNSCLGGCIGGTLTVANRFAGKSRQRSYVLAAEHLPPAVRRRIQSRLDKISIGSWPEPVVPNHALSLDEDIIRAMTMYDDMKHLIEQLPGLDCGACGSPDCEALAEDIVKGQATLDDCLILQRDKMKHDHESKTEGKKTP